MKDFIYLVQGQSDLVRNYFHLTHTGNADAIFLTYDKPMAEAIYFPNSSWAQGRNKLLEVALTQGEYSYYIFCDDDMAFKKGGWDEFEKHLMALKPAIAVPVFLQKTGRTPLKWLKYQSFLFNDETLMAFHRDVVRDGLVLPYQVRFDDVHWHASCGIQEILIQNFYFSGSIQFNNIHVSNECRHRYPNPISGRRQFKTQIRAWLATQFSGDYRDISKPLIRNLPLILWRTLRFSLRRNRRFSAPSNSVSERTARNVLSHESELHTQYLKHIRNASSG